MIAKDGGYHLHQTYWTNLERLHSKDGDDVHGLCVAVNWPHRPHDVDLLLALGHGFVARDTIGRPLGAGMWFDYENDAAMIGMMMTHPKLQAGGLGREILAKIEATLAERHLRLNATGSAWRLYRSVGFRETGSVVQYQGIVRSDVGVVSTPEARIATHTDLPAITMLDKALFGTERAQVLAQLFEASQVHVTMSAGQITGFAMCRPFGRGDLIGPLVAACEDDAVTLARGFLQTHSGRFVRLDADARHKALGGFLNAAGLKNYDTVVAMTRGTHFGPEASDTQVYALASQALG
ncbi:MAG: GNAT family N-acetyltransferase [Paracoccaceae bacterium]|nr:GNAT family N-acetyltransferase [Paracoccaceae bacterium]